MWGMKWIDPRHMTTIDTTPRSGADTFARNAMVASAFIAPLALAAGLFLAPNQVTAEGQAYVQGFVDNIDSYPMMTWIGGIFAVLAIPAIYGVSKVARRGRSTLGLIGMILAFTLAIPAPGNSDDLIYAAAKSGVDVPTITKMWNYELPTSILGLAFFLGLLGLVLIGVAALIGKTAPTWAAITLIVAPFLVPIAWFAVLPNALAAGAWVVLAVGMGGVSLGLLRDS